MTDLTIKELYIEIVSFKAPILILLFIPLLILACDNQSGKQKEPFKIERLDAFSRVDTNWVESEIGSITINDVFIIHGSLSSESFEIEIDSFACQNIGDIPNELTYHYMMFYKVSSKTNLAHLSKFPRDIDRYSGQHDKLFRSMWGNGVFVAKNAYDSNPHKTTNSRRSPCED